jgi:nitroreductase
MQMNPPFNIDETDRLLSTTRSVRKRLDLDTPVSREIITECLSLALQAPTAANFQTWKWLVVTDPAKRAELARLYNEAGRDFLESASQTEPDPATRKVYQSSFYLCNVLHQVPVHVIPCIEGRVEQKPSAPAFFGSIIPAVWSFMLALRSRGLGSAWTTALVYKEKEAAEVLGIPFDEVTQVALLPVAYTIGTDFKPGRRRPVDQVTYWDTWESTR